MCISDLIIFGMQAQL